jgi:prepilin-type N-terminal cleavage/methylation domain-containing protein
MRKGFSLIEMVIYIAILSVVFTVVVNIILSLTRSYSLLRTTRDINTGILVGFETMTREVKAADSVDGAGSTLGAHPGVLKLNTTANGSSSSVEFYLSSTTLMMKRDGVVQGPLTGSGVSVTNLLFRQITASSSQAIKMDMTLQVEAGSTTKTINVYNTVVLRGSYQ